MKPRACPDCGVLEHRTTDAKGRPTVNLDPISGKCVSCLTTSVRPRAMDEPPDWARKAANDVEE